MASQIYQDSVTLTSAAEFNKFDTAAYVALSGTAGTNTITATGPANLTLVATNPPLVLIPAATNTGATTVNITPSGGAALGAKNLFSGGVACVGGELVIGVPALIFYDGTQYNLIARGRVPITLATEQASTSGTSIDFTGIPAGVKRITIMLKGVSTNGSSNLLIQVGDSGGIESSGYLGSGDTITEAAVNCVNFTAGWGLIVSDAANVIHGSIVLTLENSAAFSWIANGKVALSNTTRTFSTAGSKSLSAELTQVRITTVNGSDTFDAGAININYE